MTPISNNTGKIIPAKIPIFRLSPKAPDTIPTNVGPPEQPISSPNASNATGSLLFPYCRMGKPQQLD